MNFSYEFLPSMSWPCGHPAGAFCSLKKHPPGLVGVWIATGSPELATGNSEFATGSLEFATGNPEFATGSPEFATGNGVMKCGSDPPFHTCRGSGLREFQKLPQTNTNVKRTYKLQTHNFGIIRII